MALNQSHYRFGRNILAENTHPWFADEDTAVQLFRGQSFLLRFCVQSVGAGQNNVNPELQCRRNGGAWQNVTTTSGIVRAISTSVFLDTDHCSQRLSGTGTFDPTNRGCSHDGTSGGNLNDIQGNGNSETEFACRVVVLINQPDDLIEFRLTRDGGTLLDSYDVTPAITVREIPDYDCSHTDSITAQIDGTVTDETRTCTALNVTNNKAYSVWFEVEEEANKVPVSVTVGPGATEQLSLSNLVANWKTDGPIQRWDGLNIRVKEPA